MERVLSRHIVSDPDAELVERCRYGDPEAFGELYARYGNMVFNLALRHLGDREEAADLTQEVFLRVFRHLRGFRGQSSLKTWIYRIALNRCHSWRRRYRPLEQGLAEEGVPAAEAAPVLVETRRGPEERAAAAETSARVLRRLAALPRPFREAVYLRDLEELGYDEIAAVLRLPIGTVRSRIARGRERLRQLLEEDEESA
ncbi:MAG: RNA polymerase sigma factor [Thermoanaerobaculia bacterium]